MHNIRFNILINYTSVPTPEFPNLSKRALTVISAPAINRSLYAPNGDDDDDDDEAPRLKTLILVIENCDRRRAHRDIPVRSSEFEGSPARNQKKTATLSVRIQARQSLSPGKIYPAVILRIDVALCAPYVRADA